VYDQGNNNAVLENRESLQAMRALWCDVIQLAWDDAFFTSKAVGYETLGKLEGIQRTARSWFGTSDFREVCAMAGVDDAAVYDAFKRKVRGWI